MTVELGQMLIQLQKYGYEATARDFKRLVEDNPSKKEEILRRRSDTLAEMAKFDEAYSDLHEVAESSRLPADFYFSGEYAIQACDFERALQSFRQVISISLNSRDGYYLASSRLLAALSCYQLNRDDECRKYLESVDNEAEVLWLQGFDRVTKQMLLELLPNVP